MMLTLILLAQLTAISPFDTWNTPDFREWFTKAKVGDWRTYSTSDGCNTCSGELKKVSDTHVNIGPTVACTLRACMSTNVYEVVFPEKGGTK